MSYEIKRRRVLRKFQTHEFRRNTYRIYSDILF